MISFSQTVEHHKLHYNMLKKRDNQYRASLAIWLINVNKKKWFSHHLRENFLMELYYLKMIIHWISSLKSTGINCPYKKSRFHQCFEISSNLVPTLILYSIIRKYNVQMRRDICQIQNPNLWILKRLSEHSVNTSLNNRYLKSGSCTIIMKKYKREAILDMISAHFFDENPMLQNKWKI